MAKKEKEKNKFKIVPDWTLPEGKSKKENGNVRIHPYALISYAQKKWGIGKACDLAINLIRQKYHQKLEESKVLY